MGESGEKCVLSNDREDSGEFGLSSISKSSEVIGVDSESTYLENDSGEKDLMTSTFGDGRSGLN